MPKRRKGASLRNGGSPSRPKHQARNPKHFLDLDREAMLFAGIASLKALGIDPTADNALIYVNTDYPEIVIHTPGQFAGGTKNHIWLNRLAKGTVLAAFSPSAQRGDSLPGALLCARHFENEPSPSQIRQTTTERWRFEESVDA